MVKGFIMYGRTPDFKTLSQTDIILLSNSPVGLMVEKDLGLLINSQTVIKFTQVDLLTGKFDRLVEFVSGKSVWMMLVGTGEHGMNPAEFVDKFYNLFMNAKEVTFIVPPNFVAQDYNTALVKKCGISLKSIRAQTYDFPIQPVPQAQYRQIQTPNPVTVSIVPVPYQPNNPPTDCRNLIKYADAYFMVNENSHDIYTKRPGGGNAVIRGHPKAVGVITGHSSGFQKRTQVFRDHDLGIVTAEEYVMLSVLKSAHKLYSSGKPAVNLYYSAEFFGRGWRISSGIFSVSDEMKDFITSEIKKIPDLMSPSEFNAYKARIRPELMTGKFNPELPF